MYRTLNADKIIETLQALALRIEERFPGSGLGKVGRELLEVAREAKPRAAAAAEPNRTLRAGIIAALAVGIMVLAYVFSIIEVKRDAENLFGVLQGIEASMNTVVLVGAAVLFLATLESRWKRQQALSDLHELRSIVHVIDMHQLTKDPSASEGPRTSSSPERVMTSFELIRYLDYSSELLSLASKIAALYADKLRDAVVIDAVGDIERLSNSLSQKIWQKINIIERQVQNEHGDRRARSAAIAANQAPPHPANTP